MERLIPNKTMLLLMMFGLLISASNAQSSCSSYRFSNSRSFTNCTDLPVLNAFIHWNYHQTNNTVDIAYRHDQITASNWIAWALNPTGGGMIGAQALVAFVDESGSVRSYTSPVTSYMTSLQQGPLSFAVPNLAGEFVGNNQMIIYATIELPQGNTSFTQVWQHGDVSNGVPRSHLTSGDHVRSTGTIDFATGATGAAAPCPPPEAANTPLTPATPSTNNCPPHTFTGGRTFADCNTLPVLNAFLHWNYEQSSNSIDIAYRHTGVTASDWVAWALHPNGGGMIGAQSLVAYAAANGSMRAYTSPITSYTTRLEEGPLSFNVPSISAEFVDNSQIIIYATIQLPQGSTGFTHLWQHGVVSGGVPQSHPTNGDNVRSVGNIDFATGSSTAGAGVGGSRQRKRNVHGVLNVVSWGILMPVGAMAARYMKVFKAGNPAWFYLHVTCQTSAYIVGVAGWATGIKLGSDSAGVKYSTHRNIGIALFALGTLQVFALLLRPKPDHKYRLYWNIYHQSIGYAVISLSIANIFEGFDILDPEKKWKNAYIGVLIALGVTAAIWEAITWYIVINRKRELNKNPHHATTNGHGNGNSYGA